MAKEKKEQEYYHGLPIDSDEEILTIMWLEELAYAGYVAKIERAASFTLCEPFVTKFNETKELKTKTKEIEKEQKILSGHIYTPEFRVTLTKAGVCLLSWRPFTNLDGSYSEVNRRFDTLFVGHQGENDEHIIYIEVKPTFDQNNMTRAFKINQKWMWERYGIFVNIIQPEELCKKTFTPNAWLSTKTGKRRVINWDVRTIEDYLLLKKQ